MKDRYDKFVFEAAKGVTFKFFEGENGELIIKSIRKPASIYSENYLNPPVFEGYRYVEGEWNSGYVIERISDGSQFVWIPVGSLDADGTLDGENFTKKFGRRNYQGEVFSEEEYHELLNNELIDQLEGIEKYGGFYISRYHISHNEEYLPQSIKGVAPWVHVNFRDAKRIASNFSTGAVRSHLTYGAEYDSVLAWLIRTGVKTREEIITEELEYINDDDLYYNGIHDLVGKFDEWTQERCGDYAVIRGGLSSEKVSCAMAYRNESDIFEKYSNTSFRICLVGD